MSSLPVIAVIGATGLQGGSVLRELLKTDQFKVRAITRNPSSDSAKKLAASPNVQVVAADMNDVESLIIAF